MPCRSEYFSQNSSVLPLQFPPQLWFKVIIGFSGKDFLNSPIYTDSSKIVIFCFLSLVENDFTARTEPIFHNFVVLFMLKRGLLFFCSHLHSVTRLTLNQSIYWFLVQNVAILIFCPFLAISSKLLGHFENILNWIPLSSLCHVE